MKFEEWGDRLLRSITALSRTAQGSNEEAYGGKKQAISLDDPSRLPQIVENNLRTAIRCIWDCGREFHTNGAQLQFMNVVAGCVSKDLLPRADSLFRTWDTSDKYPWQISPRRIRAEMDDLAATIRHQIGTRDTVKLAAEVEREIDWRIHPYADGCGRTAKLLGAWILLSKDLPPALFTDRKEYYFAMGDWPRWHQYYRDRVFS